MGERGGTRSALFCVKMSLKRWVHAVYGRVAQPKPTKAARRWPSTVKNGWGGRGAQRKGTKIVKGLSHEILNTVKMEGEDRVRSAKAWKL